MLCPAKCSARHAGATLPCDKRLGLLAKAAPRTGDMCAQKCVNAGVQPICQPCGTALVEESQCAMANKTLHTTQYTVHSTHTTHTHTPHELLPKRTRCHELMGLQMPRTTQISCVSSGRAANLQRTIECDTGPPTPTLRSASPRLFSPLPEVAAGIPSQRRRPIAINSCETTCPRP